MLITEVSMLLMVAFLAIVFFMGMSYLSNGSSKKPMATVKVRVDERSRGKYSDQNEHEQDTTFEENMMRLFWLMLVALSMLMVIRIF